MESFFSETFVENQTNFLLNETSTDPNSCQNSYDLSTFDFKEFNFPNPGHMKPRPFTWIEYLKIGLYVVAIASVMVGNIAVILAVALNSSLRITINYYLANLAVADVLICVCCMWTHLVNHLTEPLYVLGPIVCKFNGFAQMTCLTSSVLTLSAISCDRFVAIFFPLRSRVTKQRTGLVIAIIWLISLLVSIPFLIYRKHYTIEWSDFIETNCIESWPSVSEYSEEKGICIKSYLTKKIYYTFVTTTLFFIPVIVMITAYSLIVWRLWVNQMPGERNQSNVSAHKKAKKKVIKMVCILLLAFVISWMPLQIIVLYSQFGHSANSMGELPKWFPMVSYFATFIAYSNSVFNPIIYGGFNKNFRQALCSIFRCSNKLNINRKRKAAKKSTVFTATTWSPNATRRKHVLHSPYKTDVIELNNMDSVMNC